MFNQYFQIPPSFFSRLILSPHHKNAASIAKKLCVAAGTVLALNSVQAQATTLPAFGITEYGLVRGVNDAKHSGTLYWKGIPYAKAPTNELRWRAPQAPNAWKHSILNTQQFGNACLQTGRIYGPGANNTYDETIASTLNTPVGSEDCLTLNIWRPASAKKNLPVIVYLYGGSNVSGYTADPVYDGAALAKSANAIVITVNYRLGILGFLNASALKTGENMPEDSGNFALLDIIQALKFVQSNIRQFGGNANNVTLMGQSAGAVNTWALLTSPSAANLFQKAIPLSGGIALATELPKGSLATLNPATAYEKQANNLLYASVIKDGLATDAASAKVYIDSLSKPEVAEYLRAKDPASLLMLVQQAGLGGSGPIPDGNLIPVDPIASISQGNYNKMPVLAGSTSEEAKLFTPFFALFGGAPGFIVDDATRFLMMKNFDANSPTALTEADVIHPSYLPVDAATTGYNPRASLLTQIFMNVNRDSVLNALKQQQDNVWYYNFRWAQEPAPWNTIYGAAHGFDLAFLFGNFGPSVFGNTISSQENKGGRLALSQAMMKSIGHFAWCGNPNNSSLGVSWPTWPNKMVFDASLTDKSIAVE